MRVLVSTASKHGATEEIGHRIAATLSAGGLTVVDTPPEAVTAIDGYDAIVLGSAIYAGHWLASAKDFVRRFEGDLPGKRVWVFSSGPIGDPPKPVEEPADAAPMLAATSAIEHRSFAGRLEPAGLGFAEKLVTSALRAPSGDFRRWDEIDAWAESIAVALNSGGDRSLSTPTRFCEPAVHAGHHRRDRLTALLDQAGTGANEAQISTMASARASTSAS